MFRRTRAGYDGVEMVESGVERRREGHRSMVAAMVREDFEG